MKIRHTVKKNMLSCLVAIGVVFSLTGCNTNGNNSIQDQSRNDYIDWFEDTGILVRDDYDRLYHIVTDKNGWLYYSPSVDGVTCPVLDENGNPTKDISIFE